MIIIDFNPNFKLFGIQFFKLWLSNPQTTFKTFNILESSEALIRLFQIHQPTHFYQQKPMFDTSKVMQMVVTYIPDTPPPSNLYLGDALAAMEGAEAANVTASGMGAITATLLQLCEADSHIVSSRTIYGGTYAFLKILRQSST